MPVPHLGPTALCTLSPPMDVSHFPLALMSPLLVIAGEGCTEGSS